METSRITLLEQLLEQDPKSSFARYGLAMEYVRREELERAATEFATLLSNDPNYSAGYFHGGQALEKLGRLDQARDYYRQGIEVTRDAHARSELQAALDILGE